MVSSKSAVFLAIGPATDTNCPRDWWKLQLYRNQSYWKLFLDCYDVHIMDYADRHHIGD